MGTKHPVSTPNMFTLRAGALQLIAEVEQAGHFLAVERTCGGQDGMVW